MKKILAVIALTILFVIYPQEVKAMHISEGFLPVKWCIAYFIIIIPFLVLGIREIRKKTHNNKELKMMLALVAAYVFVLSAMKIPSVNGSCSHPTGIGLGAILFGPMVMSVVGFVVLVFQALLLAHGGITTLGANTFSMGVVGALVSYGVYKLFKNKNRNLAVFLAASLGDLFTYVTTSIQLGLVFPSKTTGIIGSILSFLSIFAITQIPLAIVEGILTVVIFDFIEKHCKSELTLLGEGV